MSTAADTTPTATPPAKEESEQLDPSLKLLFDSTESEQPLAAPENGERGLSLEEAMQPEEKTEGEEKKQEAPKEGEGTPPKKEEAAAPEEKPKAEEKPIRGRKKPAPEPAVAPAPTPAAPPEKKPDPVDELAGVELLDEEKDTLELAKYAEGKDPKYAGLTAKVTKYIKEHAKFIEEERKADPDAVFDASNPRYAAWLAKNKPALSASEVRSIERERVADEARSKLAPDLERMKDELFKRDAEPEVKNTGDRFIRSALDESAPEEVAKAIKEEGLEKAREKFPFEVDVIEQVVGNATRDIEEFVRLTKRNPETGRTLAKFDPNSAQHSRIVQLVDNICDDFKKNGGNATVKDGKRFLTRNEFYKLSPEQQAPYWTFSNDDVVAKARGLVKVVIRQKIEGEEKRLEKLGFKRQKVSAIPPAATPPAGAPPAPRSGAKPAGEAGPTPEEEQSKKYKSILLGE